MVYRPYENWPANAVPRNPHSPAPASVKQTPVDIPGVFHQSQQLLQPVASQPSNDNK